MVIWESHDQVTRMGEACVNGNGKPFGEYCSGLKAFPNPQ